uniref:DPEP2 neighbor n=2 Tax=Monodontidae TaxID=9747 RepID=A0A8C6AI71_MONMO
MSDCIVYTYSDLCSVPWVGSAAAAVAPVSPPTPGHYHVLCRGCGETQLGWHGETYSLVGGNRVYGDVPLASPAKVEAEKPVPRRAPKRKHAPEESDKDLSCSRPKIRRLHGARRRTPQNLSG